MITKTELKKLRANLPFKWVEKVMKKMLEKHGEKLSYPSVHAVLSNRSKDIRILECTIEVAEEYQMELQELKQRVGNVDSNARMDCKH